MRDSISRTQVKRVISPVTGAGDNTAQVGQVIDHQGYDEAEYVILTGTIADADATFTVLLEESDTNFSGAAVDDADMVSQTLGTAPETAAAFVFSSDDQVRKLAYIGSKRYTRLTITPAANTGAWGIGACCVLARRAPGVATAAQASA